MKRKKRTKQKSQQLQPWHCSFFLPAFRLEIQENSDIYNALQKDESTLLHKYVLNKLLTADQSCTAKIFLKKLLKNRVSPNPDASFGTFYVQIGQLFGRIRNRLQFPSKIAILPFFQTFFKDSLSLEKLTILYQKKREKENHV